MLLEVIPIVEIKGDSALNSQSPLVMDSHPVCVHRTPTNPKSFMEQDETKGTERQAEGWKSIDF